MQIPCISVGLAFHIQIMVQDIHIVIQSEEGRVVEITAKQGEKKNPSI